MARPWVGSITWRSPIAAGMWETALTSRRNNLLFVALGAAAVVLSGCVATGDAGQRGIETSRSVGTDCFTVSLARDFRYLDDRNLIVFVSARQPYHLELAPSCIGLRGEFEIALRARNDRMCGFAGDAVFVDGAIAQRCPVLSVTRLDENALQGLLVQFDLAEPASEGVVVEIPAEAAE